MIQDIILEWWVSVPLGRPLTAKNTASPEPSTISFAATSPVPLWQREDYSLAAFVFTRFRIQEATVEGLGFPRQPNTP